MLCEMYIINLFIETHASIFLLISIEDLTIRSLTRKHPHYQRRSHEGPVNPYQKVLTSKQARLPKHPPSRIIMHVLTVLQPLIKYSRLTKATY